MDENIKKEGEDEVKKAIDNDQNAIPYIPMSKMPSLSTVVPINLVGETLQAQYDFQEKHPDVDEYVIKKLGYSSKFILSTYLSAEQVDAVALSINQIEKGNGFILADMVGVGKGRVNAAVIRYAYQNDFLPIFITADSGLFTAIYRDIVDIGGLGEKAKPLIINGYKSGGSEKGYDSEGKIIKIKKPSPTSILDKEGNEIILAPHQDEIKQIITGKKLPSKYGMIFMTYSQLMENKVDYLKRIIDSYNGKVVIAMDECHNATGTTSRTGKAMRELVEMCQGILFSSATFSKRPENMYLYALKTDIKSSPLGTKDLLEVIIKGGERLIENLASNLVEAQQMICRLRSYDNCNIEYNYMDEAVKDSLFQKYDSALRLYKQLQKYFKASNPIFSTARANSIERFVKENKIKLVDEPRPSDEISLAKWYNQNTGKYEVTRYSVGDMKKNQFQFIETLLFAIKAEFVADQVIGNKEKKIKGQLTYDKWENLTVKDRKSFTSNRKTIIAVRNTLESVYLSLGLQVGDQLDKADFSMYVYALASDAINGTIELTEVRKVDKGENKISKKVDGEIKLSEKDFPDNGVSYNELLNDIKAIELNIPLSPIDYIIDRIETTKRPAWDEEHGGGSEYFRVGEVTGRKFRLVKKGKKYLLELNTKDNNTSSSFNKFNSGIYDCLLINEKGSTGQDAHSSEKFKDQRPRVMIIHQVELDVNTEVQKKGRIIRTGMVNYPTYVYAISRIPSEIRRLLMLVKKMRSLDANTTANQKQSAKLSTIRDSNDNEIKDVINKYGDECLNEFLDNASNSKYQQYKVGKLNIADEFGIETFIRALELAFAKDQEDFFNTINAMYIAKLEELGDMYDLETNIVDFKGAIKTRILKSKGENTNPFNTSVYTEDDYVLAQDKPYDLPKVEDLVLKLAKGEDPSEFYRVFVKDYKEHFIKHLEEVKADLDAQLKEDLKGIKNKKEREEITKEFEVRKEDTIKSENHQFESVLAVIEAKKVTTKGGTEYFDNADGNFLRINHSVKSFVFETQKQKGLTWYLIFANPEKVDDYSMVWIKSDDVEKEDYILTPNAPIKIPTHLDEAKEKDEDGLPIYIKDWNNARFLGVRIVKIAKEKYSPSNIELTFCQLSGKSKLIVKPTKQQMDILTSILTKSVDLSQRDKLLISNWEIDKEKREVIRLMTGNILGAFNIATNIVKQDDNYSPVIQFVKFTTYDGGFRYGIKLQMRVFLALDPTAEKVDYPLNSLPLQIEIIKKNFVKLRNYAENFQMVRSKSGAGNDYVAINIFGGRTDGKKMKLYTSKLFEDGELFVFATNEGCQIKDDNVNYTPVGAKRSISLLSKTILIFSIDTEVGKNKMKNVLNKIYEKDSFNVTVVGIEGEETIRVDKDPYKKSEGEQEEEKEGEYKYKTQKPFYLVKDSIKDFSKFDKYLESSDTIYLNRRASIREAMSYDLVPLDNTIPNMVEDTFAVITNDAEKIRLQQDIANAIKDNKGRFDIGQMIVNALKGKVVTRKNIFGLNDDVATIGDIFIKYSKGEIKLPEKEEKKEQKREEMPPRPLTLETAEEFLIHLNFKTK